MGLWSFYFIAKGYLYFRGFIRISFIWNLALAIFLMIRVPEGKKHHSLLVIARNFVAVIFAGLLLWHDSWLPTFKESFLFLMDERLPSKEYMFQFLLGFFNPLEALIVVSMLLACYWVRQRVKFTPAVFVLLLIVPVLEFGQPKDELDRYFDAFSRSESSRVVHFERPKGDQPNFDIVVLHICSLGWDDLKAVGLEEHAFLKQFDYLFTHFNTVTTYSTPSAIRLLRANCGQLQHRKLYNEVPGECYLFDAFRELGYQTYFTLNHDGLYRGVAANVQSHGHLDGPILPTDLSIQAYNFDSSPLFNDFNVLERWWKIRQDSGSDRAAVYYNGVSLHDGAHWDGEKEWWKQDRAENYKEDVEKLFGDLTRFFNLLTASGRNVAVVFIPEHGLGLRGNSLQTSGLRDLPLPQITNVPVGIKLIGSDFQDTPVSQQIISKPTSYLSLSFFLSSFIKQGLFRPGSPASRDVISVLPETELVTENERGKLVKKGDAFFLYGKEKKWVKLPGFAIVN
ncbi:MAG: cellulose biosynthesis protein BcsG [Nitrospiria bacterium]